MNTTSTTLLVLATPENKNIGQEKVQVSTGGTRIRIRIRMRPPQSQEEGEEARCLS